MPTDIEKFCLYTTSKMGNIFFWFMCEILDAILFFMQNTWFSLIFWRMFAIIFQS